jgi:predicted ATPase/DNA-binding SARP family transcriptional activator
VPDAQHWCLTGTSFLAGSDHATPEKVLGPLGRVALAFLIVERQRPISREQLAAVLWGDESLPQSWRVALRGIVGRLRRWLDSAGLDGMAVLTTSAGCYRMHLAPGSSVDIEVASAALDDAQRALDLATYRRAKAAAESAARVFRSDFLPGARGAWVEEQQGRARELHLQSLGIVAEAARRIGDTAAAVSAASGIVAADPYREGGYVLLMKAHAAAGNRAEAVRAFETCRERFRAELGFEPSLQTKAVYEGLATATSDQERPSPTAPLPVTALPSHLSNFVGREAEAAELRRLVESCRLVTVTGPAGVGKSRLCLEVLRALMGDDASGVHMLDCSSFTAEGGVASHLLSALRLPDVPGLGPAASLERHLADQEIVLVLDNCERVVDACAPLVLALLQAAPAVRIVVASREPLHVAGEVVWTLSPLATPADDDSESIDRLLDCGAVRLFVDRVRSVAPGHPLEPASALAAICRRLDGLPLALELAAAQARLMPLQDLARMLHDRIGLTEKARRERLRHGSLHAALDWSYEGLPAAEKRLFAQLWVFAGGFTLAAVERVCPDDEEPVVDSLTSLVDKSLVTLEAHAGAMRYRLLDTLREYASSKGGIGVGEEAVRRRHFEWVCEMTSASEARLDGDGQAEALQVFHAEQENIRSALLWADEHEGPAAAARLVVATRRFWEIRGHLAEGRRWLERVGGDGAVPEPLRAQALNGAGVLAYQQADFSAARTFHEGSLALFRSLDDPHGIATATHGLANSVAAFDDLTKARNLYEEVLVIGRQLDDKRLVGASLVNLGVISLLHVFRGQDDGSEARRARRACEEALAMYRTLGNRRGMAQSLESLGVLASLEQNDDLAVALLEESLRLSRALGDLRAVASAARSLGQIAVRRGDYEEASRLAAERLDLERSLDSKRRVAETLASLADISWRTNEFSEARRLYSQSLLQYQEVRDETGADAVLQALRQVTAGHTHVSRRE